MRSIEATFIGTGAAQYLCVGFIPDWVDILAVGDSEMAKAHWSKGFTSAASDNGFIDHGGAQATVLYTKGTGIEPYEGSDLMTSTNQTDVTYAGDGVFMGWDSIGDYRNNASYGYASSPLDTWTLDTVGSLTGHFNDNIVAAGNHIGEGSRILIKESAGGAEKEAIIETLTAGHGVSADEVLLSRAIKSGSILRISGRYDLIPIALGKVSPAGIKLNATTEINVNGERNLIRAGSFDRCSSGR
jgi:hypothetical protein